MDKRLKRYRLKINPKNGAIVDFISQVENPAIEVGFLKFKDEQLETYNDEKMEIFGPVLIPDMPIYRRSEQMGEYEIVFKADDIKEIQMEFMKNGFQNNVNLDHSNNMADSYVFESFVSSDLIPNPEPYKDLPMGTWYVRMKVTNKNVWEDIKSGKRKGFSIEGVFEYLVEEFEKHFLENRTTNIIDDQEKIKLEIMIKELFKKVFTELSKEFDEKLDDVVDESISDKVDELEVQKVDSSNFKIDSREVGAKVEVVDSNNQLVSAPDGSYEFEDGFKFTVKSGVIESIDGEVPASTDTPPADVAAADTVDYQAQIDELKKEIEDLKTLIMGVPTQESMSKEIETIKDEFKSVFEKFTKIPAEESKVVKSNILKDEQNKKFQDFLNTIRKK